jgi:hypothetical protein
MASGNHGPSGANAASPVATAPSHVVAHVTDHTTKARTAAERGPRLRDAFPGFAQVTRGLW